MAFAPKLSDLASSSLSPPGVAVYPTAGQGMALSETGRLPTPVENVRIRTEQMAGMNQTSAGTTSTSFVDTTRDEMERILLPNALTTYEAGYRPFVTLRGFLSNSGANTTVLRAAILAITEGDTGFSTIGTAGNCSMGGTTAEWCSSAWEEVAVTPAGDTDWIVVVQKRVSAGTGTFLEVHLGFRWA